ncbi:hypothetical protein EDB83DRAFT_2318750 [Lactarius deliciosus]|nr:hypothetical protein EDB83DRAFT_2318750 [Lactarius deliciosus]
MVIGQFMSEMYSGSTAVSCCWPSQLTDFQGLLAASGGKRTVPWAKLREAQGNWIAAEYLPEGVTLMQYHHICLDDANSLLKHWIQRQAAGKIPFCFKKVDKADWHHDGGAGGSSSSANGQQPCGELPTQEDEGILPPQPPNSLPLPSHTRPLPRIITQRHPHAGSSRAGPSQEHPPNDQGAQCSLQSRLSKLRAAACLQGPKHVARRRSKGHAPL